MINHVWSVLCQRSITDVETNAISLIDILEEVGILESPAPASVMGGILISCEVVSYWSRANETQAEQGKGRVTYTTPDGKKLADFEFDIDLSVHQRARTRGKLPGIPVTTSGRYYLTVSLQEENRSEWQEVAKIPFEIKFVTTTSQTITGKTSIKPLLSK